MQMRTAVVTRSPPRCLHANADQAGPVAPLTVGIHRGEIGRVARRPAAADLNTPVVLPDRVRVVVGTAGEVLGPFQTERVLQAVVAAHHKGRYPVAQQGQDPGQAPETDAVHIQGSHQLPEGLPTLPGGHVGR